MARADDFNDRQNEIDAENEPYHQYEYQTENNDSWAGALPVKQYVSPQYVCRIRRLINVHRGLYDPDLEKDACGVGFAW
jgi:glutamate synthase (NADPH/NADH)